MEKININSSDIPIFPSTSRVGAVMLTWNQKEMTLSGLESLSKLKDPKPVVLLVDNGSRDGTVEAVREKFPGVQILALPENIGFCAANNRGAEFLLKNSEIQYLLFLNNDIEIEPETVSLLEKFMDSHPSAAICGPLIYYYNPKDIIWAAGGRIFTDLMWFPPHLKGKKNPGLIKPRQVDYIHGCSIMVKRSAIEQYGLFDERLFIYHDEVDLCLRLKKAGYEVWLVPKSVLYHKVSLAVGQHSPMMIYYTARNKILFWNKHGKIKDLPKFFVFHLVKLIKIFAKVKNFWAYPSLFKALIDAVIMNYGKGHLE
ncbi:MAG: glycosyltransferase family 2 protein [Candidatus Riflebacteria bacterium]|nr:glycosyltransferase family 2 protein [Candidatus Riflebacteria bacterium]